MQEKKSTNATFSKRIKALMESKGLTEKDLCKKKKSSQSELSAWFRERGEPSVGVLFALSEALEVSVSELWLGKPENTEEVAIKGGSSFSERLQAVMREKALTQADLCKLTDIPKCSMSHYVNGTQQPRTGKLVCISRALGVNAEWLQHGEGESEQNEQEITNSIQWLEIKRLRKENERLQKENDELRNQLKFLQNDGLKHFEESSGTNSQESSQKISIVLYHYTSYENMIKIVSTLKMKAFEPGRSNDPLESRVHIALPREAQKTLIEKRDEVLSLWRMSGFCAVSFSTSCSSVPMWERYADKYKGCVLAFRFPIQSDGLVTNLENANLLPIKYDKQLPTMGDFTPETKNSIKNELIWKGLLHKGKDWEHEREIRLILNVAEIENDGSNLFFSLPASSLVGIILGPRCEGSPVVLYNFLKNRGLGIKVTEARASAEMAEIIDGTWEDWEDEEYERFCRVVPSLFLAKQNMN